MRDDFEDRLRDALHRRASRITPDPATWRKVEARMQRDRAFRLALSGTVVAAVTLLAVITVPGLVRQRIDITGAPGAGSPAEVDKAAEQPAIMAAPEAAAGYCGASGVDMVLASPEGALSATCTDGAAEPVSAGPGDAQPIFYDHSRLVFSRAGTLTVLDLELREFRELGPGSWPAVGPDGELATIADTPGDGRQPRIIVRERLEGRVVADFPVFTEGAEEFSARHLTFVDGARLAWEAGYGGAHVWTADLDGGNRRQLDIRDAARLAAPAGETAAGVIVAVRRCCVVADGDLPTQASLVAVDDGTVRDLLDVGALPGFDVASPDLVVARDGEGVLVGDGRRLYRFEPGTAARLVSGDAASAAVPPRAQPAAPGGAGLSPAPAVVTVQVHLAPAAPTDCGVTVPVRRQVQPPAVLRGALEALLAGPTPEERAQGLGGMFSAATSGYLADVRIDTQGVAHVDFHDLRAVIPNASSACGSEMLLRQLDNTVLQFPAVTAARYSIGGDEAAFYDWLQRSPP